MAVEKEPPYAVAVYQLDDASFMEGWHQMCVAMVVYQGCMQTNEWFGWNDNVDTIRIPSYAFKMTNPDSGISRMAKPAASKQVH